jgi:hypothetical protein
MTPPSRRCDAGSATIARAINAAPAVVDDQRGRRIAQQRGRRVGELLAQFRQREKRCAERRQLARADLDERDARGDAFDVRGVRERVAQPLAPCIVGDERGDRLVPRRRGCGISQRARQPLAQ